jgi:hypothetical protein
VRHQVSIVVVSHRAEFLPGVIASATAQGPEVEVKLTHSVHNWPSKINEAIAASTGEWFAFLPEDDLLDPSFTTRCLDVAANADAVFTDRRIFQEGEDPMAGEHWREFPQYQSARYYVLTPPPAVFEVGVSWPATFLCRRSWWDHLGGLDETMPQADTEWWFRAALAGGRIHYVPAPLLWYRRHRRQYSAECDEMLPFLRRFHRKHFMHFGLDFDRAEERQPDNWWVDPVPAAERAAYLAAKP